MKRFIFISLVCSIFCMGHTQQQKKVEYFSVKENLAKDVVLNWRLSPAARDYESVEIWYSPDQGNNWVQIALLWTNSLTRWKYHPTLPRRLNILQYQLVFNYKQKESIESSVKKVTIYWKNPVPKKEKRIQSYSAPEDLEAQLKIRGFIILTPTEKEIPPLKTKSI